MKAAHTAGPWRAEGGNVYADVDRYYPRPVAHVGVPLERHDNRVDELMANARLIAAAPAMEMALDLIACGAARIERSGRLVEFCFDGIRYSHNGDWGALIEVVGWDRARAAIARATA